MILGSRPPAVALLLLLFGSRSLAATPCPDGAPPPCGRAAQPAVRTPVDENVVAIFPFRVTGSSADAVTLREGARDRLQLALDEQADWRAVTSPRPARPTGRWCRWGSELTRRTSRVCRPLERPWLDWDRLDRLAVLTGSTTS
jgi:hypothetical protein